MELWEERVPKGVPHCPWLVGKNPGTNVRGWERGNPMVASKPGIIYFFCVRMGIEYIPGTQMSSIFEGQPHIIRPFPFKTRVLWVPGVYIYIYPIYILYSLLSQALLTVTFAQGVIPKRSTQRSLPLEVMTS